MFFFGKSRFDLTADNYGQAIEWMKAWLEERKVPQKDIMTAQLLLEETYVRLRERGHLTRARLTLAKRFGDVMLTFAGDGDAMNPLEAVDAGDGEEEFYRNMLLRANASRISYSYENGMNQLAIRVHAGGGKSGCYTAIALVLGIIAGLMMRTLLPAESAVWINTNIVGTIRSMFLNAVIMMVPPVVFFSLLSSLTASSDASEYGRLGGRLFIMAMVINVFGLLTGFGLGPVLFEGSPVLFSLEGASVGVKEGMTVFSFLQSIVPKTLVDPVAKNSMLQIIFLSLLFGVALNALGEKVPMLAGFVREMTLFCSRVMSYIVEFMPVVAFASMAGLMLNVGLESLGVMAKLFAADFGLIIVYLLVYGVLVKFRCGCSFGGYVRSVLRLLPTPIALSSSNAAMMPTIRFCHDTQGVPARIVSFTIPMGIPLVKIGTTTGYSLLTIMLMYLYGMEPTTHSMIAMTIAIFTAMPSLAGGTPGAGGIVITALCAAVGLPQEAVAVALCIDPIMDMCSTGHNVSGNIAATNLLCGRTREQRD